MLTTVQILSVRGHTLHCYQDMLQALLKDIIYK